MGSSMGSRNQTGEYDTETHRFLGTRNVCAQKTDAKIIAVAIVLWDN